MICRSFYILVSFDLVFAVLADPTIPLDAPLDPIAVRRIAERLIESNEMRPVNILSRRLYELSISKYRYQTAQRIRAAFGLPVAKPYTDSVGN